MFSHCQLLHFCMVHSHKILHGEQGRICWTCINIGSTFVAIKSHCELNRRNQLISTFNYCASTRGRPMDHNWCFVFGFFLFGLWGCGFYWYINFMVGIYIDQKLMAIGLILRNTVKAIEWIKMKNYCPPNSLEYILWMLSKLCNDL